LYNTTYHSNAEETDLEIPKDKQEELELLFRERDCYYRTVLQDDPGFEVLYADTLWNGCSNDDADVQELYEQLIDSDYFLHALKVNRRCPSKFDEDELHLGSVIGNHNYEEMTSHTIIVNGTYGDMIGMEVVGMAGENAPLLTFIMLTVAVLVGMSQFVLKQQKENQQQQSSTGCMHDDDDNAHHEYIGDEFLDTNLPTSISGDHELNIIT
jgi:hypothetical protein